MDPLGRIKNFIGKCVKFFLVKFIKKECFNDESLAFGIRKREISLNQLEFRPDLLDGLGLPISIRFAKIGNLFVKLSLTEILVNIKGVHILLESKHEWDEAEREKRLLSIKQVKLRLAEASSTRETGWRVDAPKGYLERVQTWAMDFLINFVISGLKFQIEDVHIRYEDNLSSPSQPFCFGMTLDSLKIASTDGKTVEREVNQGWEAALTKAKGEGVIYKELRLECFSVYSDILTGLESSTSLALSEFPDDQIDAVMSELIPSHDPNKMERSSNLKFANGKEMRSMEDVYLLHPLDTKAYFQIVGKDVPDKGVVRSLSAYMDVGKLQVSVKDIAVRSMLYLYAGIVRHENREKWGFYRPGCSVVEDPKAWWQYAYSVVLCKLREKRSKWNWKEMAGNRKDRIAYMKLWKSKLKKEATGDADDNMEDNLEAREDRRALELLEARLPYNSIISFRKDAEKELRSEGLKLIRQTRLQAWKAFLGEEEEAPEEESAEGSFLWSCRVTFKLGDAGLSLSSTEGGSAVDFLEVRMQTLDVVASLDGAKGLQQVALSLQEFDIFAGDQPTRDHLVSRRNKKEKMHGVPEPIFLVKLEMAPPATDYNARLKLQGEELEVVFLPTAAWFRMLGNFMDLPDLEGVDNWRDLEKIASRNLSNIKTGLKLEFIMETHFRLGLDVLFKGFCLIVPDYSGDASGHKRLKMEVERVSVQSMADLDLERGQSWSMIPMEGDVDLGTSSAAEAPERSEKNKREEDGEKEPNAANGEGGDDRSRKPGEGQEIFRSASVDGSSEFWDTFKLDVATVRVYFDFVHSGSWAQCPLIEPLNFKATIRPSRFLQDQSITRVKVYCQVTDVNVKVSETSLHLMVGMLNAYKRSFEEAAVQYESIKKKMKTLVDHGSSTLDLGSFLNGGEGQDADYKLYSPYFATASEFGDADSYDDARSIASVYSDARSINSLNGFSTSKRGSMKPSAELPSSLASRPSPVQENGGSDFEDVGANLSDEEFVDAVGEEAFKKRDGHVQGPESTFRAKMNRPRLRELVESGEVQESGDGLLRAAKSTQSQAIKFSLTMSRLQIEVIKGHYQAHQGGHASSHSSTIVVLGMNGIEIVYVDLGLTKRLKFTLDDILVEDRVISRFSDSSDQEYPLLRVHVTETPLALPSALGRRKSSENFVFRHTSIPGSGIVETPKAFSFHVYVLMDEKASITGRQIEEVRTNMKMRALIFGLEQKTLVELMQAFTPILSLDLSIATTADSADVPSPPAPTSNNSNTVISCQGTFDCIHVHATLLGAPVVSLILAPISLTLKQDDAGKLSTRIKFEEIKLLAGETILIGRNNKVTGPQLETEAKMGMFETANGSRMDIEAAVTITDMRLLTDASSVHTILSYVLDGPLLPWISSHQQLLSPSAPSTVEEKGTSDSVFWYAFALRIVSTEIFIPSDTTRPWRDGLRLDIGEFFELSMTFREALESEVYFETGPMNLGLQPDGGNVMTVGSLQGSATINGLGSDVITFKGRVDLSPFAVSLSRNLVNFMVNMSSSYQDFATRVMDLLDASEALRGIMASDNGRTSNSGVSSIEVNMDIIGKKFSVTLELDLLDTGSNAAEDVVLAIEDIQTRVKYEDMRNASFKLVLGDVGVYYQDGERLISMCGKRGKGVFLPVEAGGTFDDPYAPPLLELRLDAVEGHANVSCLIRRFEVLLAGQGLAKIQQVFSAMDDAFRAIQMEKERAEEGKAVRLAENEVGPAEEQESFQETLWSLGTGLVDQKQESSDKVVAALSALPDFIVDFLVEGFCLMVPEQVYPELKEENHALFSSGGARLAIKVTKQRDREDRVRGVKCQVNVKGLNWQAQLRRYRYKHTSNLQNAFESSNSLSSPSSSRLSITCPTTAYLSAASEFSDIRLLDPMSWELDLELILNVANPPPLFVINCKGRMDPIILWLHLNTSPVERIVSSIQEKLTSKSDQLEVSRAEKEEGRIVTNGLEAKYRLTKEPISDSSAQWYPTNVADPTPIAGGQDMTRERDLFLLVEINCKIEPGALRLKVINDLCRQTSPLLEVSIANRRFIIEGGEGLIEAELQGDLFCNSYNKSIAAWEPFIEPWDFSTLCTYGYFQPMRPETQKKEEIIQHSKSNGSLSSSDPLVCSSPSRAGVPRRSSSKVQLYNRPLTKKNEAFVTFKVTASKILNVNFTETFLESLVSAATAMANARREKGTSHKAVDYSLYWIRNDSGVDLNYQISNQEARHLKNNEKEVLNVGLKRDPSQPSSQHLRLILSRSGQLPWKPINRVSADREGIQLYSLRMSHEDKDSGLGSVKVACEVSLNHGIKLLQVRSTVSFRNTCTIGYRVSLKAYDNLQWTTPQILPNSGVPLPLYLTTLTDVALVIEPVITAIQSNKSNKKRKRVCFNIYSYLELEQSLLSEAGHPIYLKFSPNAAKTLPLYCVYHLDRDVDSRGRVTEPKGHHAVHTFSPPLILMNLIPQTCEYQLCTSMDPEGGSVERANGNTTTKSGNMAAGKSFCWYRCSDRHEVNLTIRHPSFGWSKPLIIPAAPDPARAGDPTASIPAETLELVFVGERNVVLNLCVEVTWDHRARRLKLFAPFWILNTTGLPLEFGHDPHMLPERSVLRADGLIYGYGEDSVGAETTDRSRPLIFGRRSDMGLASILPSQKKNKDSFFSFMKQHLIMAGYSNPMTDQSFIRLRLSQSSWCRTLPVNTIGQMGLLELTGKPILTHPGRWYSSAPKKTGAFALSVKVDVAAPPFERTKVVRVCPRYILVNAFGRAVEVRQEGEGKDGGGSVNLPFGQKSPWYWVHRDGRRRLRVRLKEFGWEWSGGFSPDNLADVTFRLRNTYTDAKCLLQVRVTQQDNKNMIFFRREPTAFAPFRIENRTLETLQFGQVGFEYSEVLLPYHACPYAWDEHTLLHLLDFKLVNTKEKLLRRESLGFFSFDQDKPIIKNGMRFDVITNGATRVMVITDARGGSLVPQPRGPDIGDVSFDVRASGGMQLILEVAAKGVGLSVINGVPQELLYASVQDVEIRYEITWTSSRLRLRALNVQVDNQLVGTPCPVMLMRKDDQNRASFAPATKILLEQDFVYERIFYIRELAVHLAPHYVSVDGNLIAAFLQLGSKLMNAALADDQDGIQGKGEELALQKTLNESGREDGEEALVEIDEDRVKTYFKKLSIDPIKLDLSFVASSVISRVLSQFSASGQESKIYRTIKVMLDAIGGTIVRVDNAPIRFSDLAIEHVYSTEANFKIMSHYYKQAVGQAYILLGTLDVLGNPIGLINNLWIGIRDFLFEPVMGFRKSPIHFGLGIYRGTISLLSRLLYSALDSSQSFCSSLHAGIEQLIPLTRNERYIPSGYIKALWKSLRGLVIEPTRGYKTAGLRGLSGGLALGLANFFLFPILGALEDAVEICDTGRKWLKPQMAAPNKTQRVRPPRLFRLKTAPLLTYSAEETLVENVLNQVDGGRYRKEGRIWYCFLVKGSCCLLTSRRVMLVKVIGELYVLDWQAPIKDILQVEIEGTTVSIDYLLKATGVDFARTRATYATGINEKNGMALIWTGINLLTHAYLSGVGRKRLPRHTGLRLGHHRIDLGDEKSCKTLVSLLQSHTRKLKLIGGEPLERGGA